MPTHDPALAPLRIDPAIQSQMLELDGALGMLAQTFTGGGHSEQIDGMSLGCMLRLLSSRSSAILAGMSPN